MSTPPNEDAEATIPRDEDAALRDQLDRLERALHATAAAARRPALIEGILWWCATACAVIASALIVALVCGKQLALDVAPWVVLLGGLATIAAGLVALARFRSGRPDAASTARFVQRHAAPLRQDLSSAIVFGHQILDGTFDHHQSSETMARAHIARAALAIGELSNEYGHLAHLVPVRDNKPAAIALGGGLAITALIALVAPDWVPRSLIGALPQTIMTATEGEQEAITKRPLVGNLTITWTPPSYSGLEAGYEPFTTGNIATLAGSQITIEGAVIRAHIDALTLVIQGAQGAPQERRLEVARGAFSTLIVAPNESFSYVFRAVTKEGEVIEDPTPRRVEITPDKAPQVQILSHEGEIEVSTEDVLTLEYAAQDDFGITGTARIHAFGFGDESDTTRHVLDEPLLQTAPTEFSGTHTIDLAALGLQPKDRVTLYIEATDNNTLTGPRHRQEPAHRARRRLP